VNRTQEASDPESPDHNGPPNNDPWANFSRSWIGLASYRYLNKTTPVLDAGFEDDELESMPLRHDMRNSHGGVLAAPLAICAPEPYWTDDQVVPAPVTASIQILDDARGIRRLAVLRDVISLGRRMGFSRSRIVDADNHNRVVAISSGSGVSLGDAPAGYTKTENTLIDVVDSPTMARLHEVFGVEKGSDNQWRLPPLRQDQSAPHSALHIGPMHILADHVAHLVAGNSASFDAVQVTAWSMMFVRPGLIGPFRAKPVMVGGSWHSPKTPQEQAKTVGVEVTIHDEGSHDAIIAVASGSFIGLQH